jgi:hypothetical protein
MENITLVKIQHEALNQTFTSPGGSWTLPQLSAMEISSTPKSWKNSTINICVSPT